MADDNDDSEVQRQQVLQRFNELSTDTYYPVTLPWRKPNSGDPDILDEAEFGEAATEYDENAINPASELGLLNPDDTSEETRLMFLQLPNSLPSINRSATAEGEQIEQGYSLNDLPPGYMGKMRVYNSGAVKLKLGETQYDVSPGSTISDVQEVVAVNTEKKEFVSVGDLDKRMIITPDVDDILDKEKDLG
ncbi:hypothetical protein BVRB_3g067900 isoform B [Beta vulgaris subsp. vulgaris]|nr:hypothetical protein BVRB_3g067900 isoform B [Beta vulgaris subsp. vulgaris]